MSSRDELHFHQRGEKWGGTEALYFIAIENMGRKYKN